MKTKPEKKELRKKILKNKKNNLLVVLSFD